MENLKKIYSKALAKKGINKQISRGAYCVQILETYLKKNYNISNIQVKGKINNNILFIGISPENLAMEVFLLKEKIIKHINQKLNEMNYNKINQIRKKQFDF